MINQVFSLRVSTAICGFKVGGKARGWGSLGCRAGNHDKHRYVAKVNTLAMEPASCLTHAPTRNDPRRPKPITPCTTLSAQLCWPSLRFICSLTAPIPPGCRPQPATTVAAQFKRRRQMLLRPPQPVEQLIPRPPQLRSIPQRPPHHQQHLPTPKQALAAVITSRSGPHPGPAFSAFRLSPPQRGAV